MKLNRVFVLTSIGLFCLSLGYASKISNQTATDISKRIHVYCECHNRWINGRIENFASVELRSGTSFGPVLSEATVEVNGRKLAFDDQTQTYSGDINRVEQWQEIPIRIQTRDGRKVRGHVAVVFMVQFTEPKPSARVSTDRGFPVSWKYSEGSMCRF
jgi:hypothetical protein